MECSPEVSVTIDYRKLAHTCVLPEKPSLFRRCSLHLFLHMSVNSYGNIERSIQKISLLRLFQLCKLFDVRPESILHNCCPELVGKEDELPLTDNQESNALLQRIATCSTAELQFFVDQLPALRQFKPKR